MLNRFPIFETMTYFINNQETINDEDVKPYYLEFPRGKRYYAWFTFLKNNDVCVFVDCKTNQYFYEKVSFSKLSLGTVLYGTLVEYKTTKMFIAENIFTFAGKIETNNLYMNKLSVLRNIFCHYANEYFPKKTKIYMSNINEKPSQQNYVCIYPDTICSVVPPLPPVSFTHSKTKRTALPPPPPPPPSQHFVSKTKKTAHTAPPPAPTAPTTFCVKADIMEDIYHLYIPASRNHGKMQYFNVALIPSYKTSIFMNRIFRKNKEHTNLDLLEESDDEEEFQNISYDKNVNTEKMVLMKCIYNTKFRRWVPVKICH